MRIAPLAPTDEVCFYDADLSSSTEAARLRRMAGAADAVAALGSIVDRPGAILGDVGAGESTSLGRR